MPLTSKRLITLFAEVLIALAMVAGVILYANVGPISWMPSSRWWGLAGITGLLFWGVAKRYRTYWSRISFWLKLSGLLAVHLCAWTVVLLRAPQWGLLWFTPPAVIEAVVMVFLLDQFGVQPSADKEGRST